jgi:DHA1 family inner membrane transport protein
MADTAGWRWAVLIVIPLPLLVLAGAGELRESPNPAQAKAARNWVLAYRSILAQRAVTSMLGAMVLILVARFGWFIYLGAYGEKALKASALTLGLVFAAGGVSHMIGSNLAPLLLARFPARRIAAAAAVVMALALATVGLYSDEAWSMFPFVALFSVCWAICFVTSSIYLLDLAPAARSTVSALQSAAMELGIALGAAVGGVLLSVLDDYERMFRSLALVIPVALALLVAGSMKPLLSTDGPVPAETPA